MAGTSAAVWAKGLAFSYRRTRVFDSIDVELTQGTNFVVGVNGVGKTTLLRLILGDLRPVGGTGE